ncbi:MAG: hypothetical protein IID34_06075 [Planctomycetes bacterium]|nr:hypothetical protein [Planctomycetota bacterium]
MPEAARRFVILHHVGYGRPHWDFMLEQDQSLATWRVYHDLLEAGKEEWELFRIEDHRKFYLDHEGPIAGHRGEVRRVCGGTYELREKNSQTWTIRLRSVVLAGDFQLRLTEGERWLMKKVSG